MTTPFRRDFVSMAIAIATTLVLGACARASLLPPRDIGRHVIRFDNQGREHVHVYLIGAKRQWLLGRVEAGVVTTLRIPEESLAESTEFVQLAVITGEGVTLEAVRNARATLTVAQPASSLLSQRWEYAQGQLMSLRR